MKTNYAIILSASLLGLSSLSQADDDIRTDEAVKLAEAGTIKTVDELNAAILELHPGATIDDTELELERDVYVYQVELRIGTPSEEWDVEIDAATGEVLSNHRDD
jgi:uncharacterized membrane protein YkoI